MTDTQRIRDLILSKKIIIFNDLERIIKSSRMTIIRRLQELSYISSYSHSRKYYTLSTVPNYSKEGIWNYMGVYFSKYGNLTNTCYCFINRSMGGYSVKELEEKLHVDVKKSLIKLHKKGDLYREKFNGVYIYFHKQYLKRKQQLIIRQSQNEITTFNINTLSSDIITNELKATIILFYSILDEKQRRLYAGMESLKIGHGGDTLIAKLLNIDSDTVSKGRKELISGEFEKEGVRKQGSGRPNVKKNS